jgi:large subunit ribosomal protein L11
VLGSKGVNPGQFIQKFNAATQAVKGKLVGCIVTVYNDRSFELEVKGSPASAMIKELAKIEKGSGVPNKNKVGTITKDHVRKIAEAKMADLNAASVEAAMRIIEGTARSMGVTVA